MLRILPLFVLAVLIYYWLGMIGLVNLTNVSKAILFQSYYNHLWTIPIEFTFYFVLPIILVFMLWFLKDRNRPMLVISAAFFLVTTLAFLFKPEHPDDIKLLYYIPCFCFGMLAALAVYYLPKPSRRIAQLSATAAISGILLFVFIQKSGLATSDITNSISAKYSFFGFMWAVFTYCIWIEPSGFWAKILAFRPLAGFGLIIYSTYLFHWIFMEWIPKIQSVYFAPASVVLSVLAGYIGYLCFEKPIYSWRKPIVSMLRSN